MDNLKLLAIVTGEGEFVNKNLRTGLWLSELTHIYHGAKKQGIEITVASPKGGDTPIDPEVSIRPRACFFPLFSFLPLWLHYNLNPLCVQY